MSVPTGWYKPVGIKKKIANSMTHQISAEQKRTEVTRGLIKRFPQPLAKLNRQLKIGTSWVRTRIQFAKEKRYVDASHVFDAGTRGRLRVEIGRAHV